MSCASCYQYISEDLKFIHCGNEDHLCCEKCIRNSIITLMNSGININEIEIKCFNNYTNKSQLSEQSPSISFELCENFYSVDDIFELISQTPQFYQPSFNENFHTFCDSVTMVNTDTNIIIIQCENLIIIPTTSTIKSRFLSKGKCKLVIFVLILLYFVIVVSIYAACYNSWNENFITNYKLISFLLFPLLSFICLSKILFV